MRFPNAYKGVKKLFVTEILCIIVEVVAIVAAILAAFSAGSRAMALSAGTLALISGIATAVVLIFQLIGLFQGSREIDQFRIALWLVLVGLIASVTSAILQSIDATKGIGILFAILATISAIADLFVVICVINGIADVANTLGDAEMEDKGRRLAFLVIFVYVVSLILGFIPGFNAYVYNEGWRIVFSIFSITALVLELVVFISVLIYLYRATKMLEKN